MAKTRFILLISLILIFGTAAQAQDLKNQFRELQKSLKEISKDTFDTREAVKMIGKESERLFEWVRDETYLVPYSGMLRGAAGVLMDRSGNSLDRALLLQELLRKAGRKARLAQGTLTEADASRLYQLMLAIPDETYAVPSYNSFSELKRQVQADASRYGLDPDRLIQDLEPFAREQERVRVDLMRRVQEQSYDILSHVGKYIPSDGDVNKQKRIEILQDHWWVRMQQEEEWVDMDPSFPQAQPGWSAAQAEKTYLPNQIPKALKHSVTLRVIIERWENGQATEEKVLEREFYPSDPKGDRIVFYQQPLNWPDIKAMSKSNDPVPAFRQAVMDQNEWLPILQVGSRTIKKASVMSNGSLNSLPGKQSASKSRSLSGGLMGGFGGGSKKTVSEDSILTAEWLEYEILSPGLAPKLVRRPIFDLIGPANRQAQSYQLQSLTDEMKFRRNLAMLNQTEVLFMAGRWSAPYVETRMLQKTLDLKKELTALAEKGQETSFEDTVSLLDQMSSLNSLLERVALSRTELSPFAREAFISRPNVLSLQTFLAEQDEGIRRVQAVDIIANEMASIPIPGMDTFSLLIHQGVADTNAELKPLIQEQRVHNTSEVHEISKEQKIQWSALTNPEDLSAFKGWMEPDVLALIEKDLGEGYLILLPEKIVEIDDQATLAWWRLDPKTGNVLGMGENGMGQAMTGYAERANVVLQMKSSIQFFSDIMRCMATAITSPLRGNRPQDDDATLECVWNIACGAINSLAATLVQDVNWTNIIISETVNAAWGGLCKGLAEEIF